MKNFNKSNENSTIKISSSRTSQKLEVNLPKNSSLYFQIGLIICLLTTYGLFEMNFEKSIPQFSFANSLDEPHVIFITEPRVVPDEVVKKRRPDRKVAVLIDKAPIIAKKNEIIDLPNIVIPAEAVPDMPTATYIAPETPNKTEPTSWNMIDVERVPVFPGCESAINNVERMACMSEKLTQLIQKKFNTDLASELGLTGIQRIYVQFKIDATGHVTDIKTRSPYSQLEKEAHRVVGKIPIMTPGKQRNTPVSVIYDLPIVFKVQ